MTFCSRECQAILSSCTNEQLSQERTGCIQFLLNIRGLSLPAKSANITDESRFVTRRSAVRHPKALPLRAALALVRFLLRTGRSRLKMVSWSLSSSDSDIMRLELCSVLRCLIPAERGDASSFHVMLRCTSTPLQFRGT